jgi:YegS/Rv2252/BmrU family lipid kinase
MVAMNNFLFIINPFSGRGQKEKTEIKIASCCRRQHVECTVMHTEAPGHAAVLAKQHAGKFDAIIAVGGDGTVNEVARALVHTRTPMGIIPNGSGNGLARHLGIPMKTTEAIKTLFNSVPTLIDTFRINGNLGVNVAGIGFDGHIANRFGNHAQRGLSGYTQLVIADYFSYPEFSYQFTYEGEHHHGNGFIVSIANSSQFGNNAFIAPAASVTDGMLDFVSVRKIPIWRLPTAIARLFTRKLSAASYYSVQRLTDFNITCEEDISFHIDGESCSKAKEFSIQTDAASLLVLRPRNKTI